MRARTLWAAIALSVVMGCGDSTRRDATDVRDAGPGSTSDAGATGTVATWVSDLTTAYCNWAIHCGRFGNAITCKAYQGPQIDVINFDSAPAAVTAVSDGRARFDESQAASCLNALSKLDCADEFLNPQRMPEACFAAFSGNVADGDACIDDVECTNGSLCIIESTTTCTGKCTPPGSVAYCRTNSDCPSQQYCSGPTLQGPGLYASGVCEAIVPPGASSGDACGTPVLCVPVLSCAGGPAPAGCGKPPGSGEPCGGPIGIECAPGLACVPTGSDRGTCMAPAKLGEPCTSRFQCGAQYALSDIVCDLNGTHKCVHASSKGSCTRTFEGDTCDPVTSYCDGSDTEGTCKPWVARGERCSDVAPCANWDTCEGGVCVPALGACTPK